MDAKTARRITESSSKQPGSLGVAISILNAEINKVAQSGGKRIDPWATLNDRYILGRNQLRQLSLKGRKCLRKHYKSKGFKWKECPGPDPQIISSTIKVASQQDGQSVVWGSSPSLAAMKLPPAASSTIARMSSSRSHEFEHERHSALPSELM